MEGAHLWGNTGIDDKVDNIISDEESTYYDQLAEQMPAYEPKTVQCKIDEYTIVIDQEGINHFIYGPNQRVYDFIKSKLKSNKQNN